MNHPLLALGVALLLASPVLAQKVPLAKVPAAAKVAFQTSFATASGGQWAKEGADYEVGFTQAGKKMSAVITASGELKETETELAAAQLPAAVRATLARDYRTAKVGEAASIRRADGRTVYEAEISQGGKKHDVLFTANGQVTK